MTCEAFTKGVTGPRMCHRPTKPGRRYCAFHDRRARSLRYVAPPRVTVSDLDPLRDAVAAATRADVDLTTFLHALIRATDPPPPSDGSCSIEDCTEKSRMNGMCLKHAQRLKRHGNAHIRFGEYAP